MKALIGKLLIAIMAGTVMLFSSTVSAQQIELVSMNFSGTGAGDDFSTFFVGGHRKSAQGRYVGFVSLAKNIVPNGAGPLTFQLYLRDLETGVTQLISKNYQTGGPSNNGATTFEFSKDGRYLAFLSISTDLLPGVPNTKQSLYLRDMQTGVLKVVNVSTPGQPVNAQYTRFSISDDGKKLAFASLGWNGGFPYDRNHIEDVYVFDLDTGRTTLASVDRSGVRAGNGPSNLVQISGNGRYVLFASSAGNLVNEPVATNVRNLYVRDLLENSTKLVSVTRAGTGGNVADVSENYSPLHHNWISDDGRYVTFFGIGDDYTANDNNNYSDLFQRDLVAGTTSLVSVHSSGVAGGAIYSSSTPDFAATPDGRYVVFIGTHLAGGPQTLNNDCFVRDTVTGTTRSVSGALPRATALSLVEWVDISPDGRNVFFNLIERPDGSTDIHGRGFLYDLTTGQMTELSAPQGTFLGDVGGAGFSPGSDLFVFNTWGRLSPLDNNNDTDVYVVHLGSSTKPRRVVALANPLGQ